MLPFRPILAVGTMLAMSLGCAGTYSPFDAPGTTAFQQARASLHDPYVDNDAGPAVVGGRPREFDAPRDETVKMQWIRNTWWGPRGR